MDGNWRPDMFCLTLPFKNIISRHFIRNCSSRRARVKHCGNNSITFFRVEIFIASISIGQKDETFGIHKGQRHIGRT
jgi:hypothetical protein